MSYAKQLHNRRYLNDYFEIINREGLPGNVKTERIGQTKHMFFVGATVASPKLRSWVPCGGVRMRQGLLAGICQAGVPSRTGRGR